VASFTAPRAIFSADAPLRVAVFGDLGLSNAQSLTSLQDEALHGADLFLSLGDYGYNLEYQDGAVGDAFQAAMESITSTQMYQGVVGNHVRRMPRPLLRPAPGLPRSLRAHPPPPAWPLPALRR
jgi:hypothetical protein